MYATSETQKNIFILKKKNVGFYVFLMVFPLDAIFSALSDFLGFEVPVGMFGVLLSFCSIPLLFEKSGRELKYILLYALFVISIMFLVSSSSRVVWLDYYFWVRSLAFFTAGYLFFDWMVKSLFHRSKQFKLLTILVVIISLLPFFWDFDEFNYLRLSMSLLISVLLLFSYIKSRSVMFFCFLLLLLPLYYYESRFSLLAFFIIVPVVFLVEIGFKLGVILSILAVFSVWLIYGFGYDIFVQLDSVHDNRFLRLIYAIDQDTSFISRNELSFYAYEIFINNPVFGVYKYYRDFGSDGAYAHNIISFWAELGIIGVIYSLSLIVLCVCSVFKAIKILHYNYFLARFVLYASLLVLLGAFFAKSYVWSVLYFVFGLCMAFIINYKVLFLTGKNEHHLPPPPSAR